MRTDSTQQKRKLPRPITTVYIAFSINDRSVVAVARVAVNYVGSAKFAIAYDYAIKAKACLAECCAAGAKAPASC